MLRSPDITNVEIPKDLLSEIEEIPDSNFGPDGWRPTEQEAAIILKFYKRKNKEMLAKKLGISYGTLKKWYSILSQENNPGR